MMDDTREKLETETKNLNAFKAILNKSNEQTKTMCAILSHFDERLAKLEETIAPVYKETGNLQLRQENIVKTLENLDYVIKFYTVSSEVEPIIRAGISQNSLQSFLFNVEKLKDALNYFEQNNPESPELMNVSALYEKGGNIVETEFRQLLSRHSKSIAPVIIYDLVNEDESSLEAEKNILEQIPEKTKSELKALGEWLCNNRKENFISAYSSLRAEVLVKSLQALKDHQKSSSGGNPNATSGIHSSPLSSRKNVLTPLRDTPPNRKTPKSIQQVLKKKLHDVIPSEMLGGKPSHPIAADLKEDISISEREIVFYLTCVTALYKLMQCELKLMEGIIAIRYQKIMFSRLVYPALENVVAEGEHLANRVKKFTARHDFMAALSLFPLLRHQATMRHSFDLLFDGCSVEVQSKFQGLVVTLQTTINRTLEEFIDYIKTDTETKVPKDGTVHELTSNTMIFVVNLMEHLDILSRVITITDMQSVDSSMDKNRWAYAQYISRVLSALGQTLQTKSEAYSDIYLRAIFLLNNYHYILQTLRKSHLLDIVSLYEREIEFIYESKIIENKRVYSQSWSRVLHFVLEMDKPLSQQRMVPEMNQIANMKLKDKDRQNIKDKFAEFEEIKKAQTAYAVPNAELRESLKRDNIDFIVPKYKLFYDKYINMNFTKNLDKYAKYTPDDVAAMIDTFFDSAA
ncbi:exocyst complex component 7-like protein [Dinothrombium tinctorium]|uniref:Exocyst complex component 7 n=1 Tax=Dinothrombium tinctorium TaxID=1965070 RepID=A0A3S4QFN3_9ACAR|nr:exocyst complex component 7-like protein [Dinothrombium tinctorium]